MVPSGETSDGGSAELSVDTSTRQVVDLTEEIIRLCRGRPAGLLNVFVPHATAGLAIMETGSGSEPDLVELLTRILPRDDRYQHRHGSPGHGADHLLPVVVSPSLVVPMGEGRPLLGTWQRIVLVDLNADNPKRRVLLTFLGLGG